MNRSFCTSNTRQRDASKFASLPSLGAAVRAETAASSVLFFSRAMSSLQIGVLPGALATGRPRLARSIYTSHDGTSKQVAAVSNTLASGLPSGRLVPGRRWSQIRRPG